jgi:hypothetical protein
MVNNPHQWAKKTKKTLWRHALGFLFWAQNFYLLVTSWVSLDLFIWNIQHPPLLCQPSSLKLHTTTEHNYEHLYGTSLFSLLLFVSLLVPFLIIICISIYISCYSFITLDFPVALAFWILSLGFCHLDFITWISSLGFRHLDFVTGIPSPLFLVASWHVDRAWLRSLVHTCCGQCRSGPEVSSEQHR